MEELENKWHGVRILPSNAELEPGIYEGVITCNGNLRINGDGVIRGSLQAESLEALGSLLLEGGINITEDLTVNGDLLISGGVNIGGDIEVNGNLRASGGVNVGGDINVGKNCIIEGGLNVGGDIISSGNITIKIQGNNTSKVSGDIEARGFIKIFGENKLYVDGDIEAKEEIFLENVEVSGNVKAPSIKFGNSVTVHGEIIQTNL